MKKIVGFSLVAAIFMSSCSDTTVTSGKEDLTLNETPVVVGQFRQHVLIEDFTGTWCGNCTRVALAVERVNAQTDKAVVVGVHNGNDPYSFADIEPLRAQIYPSIPDFPLPTARLNRTITWAFPEQDNVQQVLDLTGNSCMAGLAMSSTVASGNVSLDVNMKFSSDATLSNLRLVVYALEDNLTHFQTNYLPSYGPNPIANFVHNHVLRACFTNILGDAVNENSLAGKTISRHFELSVPATFSNAENMHFVAFLIDANNTAVNVRAAAANETQDFEENQ